MKAQHEKLCCVMGLSCLLTGAYTAYVTITHGDGVAFAAFVGGIGVLAGYLVAKK